MSSVNREYQQLMESGEILNQMSSGGNPKTNISVIESEKLSGWDLPKTKQNIQLKQMDKIRGDLDELRSSEISSRQISQVYSVKQGKKPNLVIFDTGENSDHQGMISTTKSSKAMRRNPHFFKSVHRNPKMDKKDQKSLNRKFRRLIAVKRYGSSSNVKISKKKMKRSRKQQFYLSNNAIKDLRSSVDGSPLNEKLGITNGLRKQYFKLISTKPLEKPPEPQKIEIDLQPKSDHLITKSDHEVPDKEGDRVSKYTSSRYRFKSKNPTEKRSIKSKISDLVSQAPGSLNSQSGYFQLTPLEVQRGSTVVRDRPSTCEARKRSGLVKRPTVFDSKKAIAVDYKSIFNSNTKKTLHSKIQKSDFLYKNHGLRDYLTHQDLAEPMLNTVMEQKYVRDLITQKIEKSRDSEINRSTPIYRLTGNPNIKKFLPKRSKKSRKVKRRSKKRNFRKSDFWKKTKTGAIIGIGENAERWSRGGNHSIRFDEKYKRYLEEKSLCSQEKEALEEENDIFTSKVLTKRQQKFKRRHVGKKIFNFRSFGFTLKKNYTGSLSSEKGQIGMRAYKVLRRFGQQEYENYCKEIGCDEYS